MWVKKIISRFWNIAHNTKLWKFIFKLVLLLLPVLLFLFYVESQLAHVAISYKQKRHELEHQIDKIEVLVLGSSNAYFGVNPHYFSYKGFNLAYRAQWPYYDLRLVEKYIDRMPNLKLVIFSVNYFTFGTQLVDIADNWRIYFYAQYYKILPHKKGLFLGLYHPLDPRNYSKIALFGERARDYFLHGTTDLSQGEAAEDQTGWFNAGTQPCDLTKKIGESASNAHNLSIDVMHFNENLHYMSLLVNLLRAKNIEFVLVELPEMHCYTDGLDPAKYGLMEKKLSEFAKKHQIKYLNYTHAARFGVNEFTDMPDHLNALGAKKISKIIDQDIIIPAFQPRSIA